MPEKIFITRDCLNAGITEDEATSTTDGGWATGSSNYRPGDWHRTRAEAVAKAETMRVAELERLRKRVAQLEAMDFTKEAV